jgi:hypothetical protein
MSGVACKIGVRGRTLLVGVSIGHVSSEVIGRLVRLLAAGVLANICFSRKISIAHGIGAKGRTLLVSVPGRVFSDLRGRLECLPAAEILAKMRLNRKIRHGKESRRGDKPFLSEWTTICASRPVGNLNVFSHPGCSQRNALEDPSGGVRERGAVGRTPLVRVRGNVILLFVRCPECLVAAGELAKKGFRSIIRCRAWDWSQWTYASCQNEYACVW